MSRTTPVAIVDKNGRATTVHRRDTTDPSTSTSLPSPKVGPQNAAQGNPLEPLVPATRSQLKELIREFSTGEEYWRIEPQNIAREVTKTGQTLIRRMLDDPALDRELVRACVQYGIWDDSVPKEEITSALLIFEGISANGDEALLKTSGPSPFFEAVLGMDQVSTRPSLDPVQPITTQEELDAKVAVTTFVLSALQNYTNDDSIVRRREKQFNFKWRRSFIVVNNKHLQSLIMERPDKQREITDYVRNRGMHPINKKPVDALRAYLDEAENTTTLSSGWL